MVYSGQFDGTFYWYYAENEDGLLAVIVSAASRGVAMGGVSNSS
jgi:hypothetical protein